MRKVYLGCNCGDLGHLVRVSYDEESGEYFFEFGIQD